MSAGKQVSLILTGQAIASLRESDFDMVSAVGEVIDNSLQAGASEINVALKEVDRPAKGRRPAGTKQIIEMAFGDDGQGMDVETLHQCLQLGFSTRYNDRSGIGRFGVGVTLGAISQCMRIDLYSKPNKKAAWRHTSIDLDEARKNPFIPAPVEVKFPEEYLGLVGRDHGTLMIWRKCDRVSGTRAELEHWLARTYRKFIGASVVEGGKVIKNPDVKVIHVNGTRLIAFDPLFAVKSKDFPAGTAAKLFEPIHLDVPIPSEAGSTEKVSTITIQMSLLPEQWRPEGGAGGSQLAKQLVIPENEGFSILRANREVFYDTMQHFEPVRHSDGYDRWWSAEISFDPILDQLFSVRNVKRGARFKKDLREKIQEQMAPTIHEARREVKKVYEATRKNQHFNKLNLANEHTEAEKAVQAVNPPAGKAGKGKTEAEKQREVEKIIQHVGQSEDELAAWRAKIEGQPCTIVDRDETAWRGNTFIDVHPQGGRTIIEYNRGHEFFVFVYNTIKALEGDATTGAQKSAVEHARALKSAIDLLFMAYAQAMCQLDLDQEQRVSETLEFLESNWGLFLRQYVKNFQKNG